MTKAGPSSGAASAARARPSGRGGAPRAASGTRWSRRSSGRRPPAVRPPAPSAERAVPIAEVDADEWAAAADGHRRARPGARRRAGAGLGHPARRRARHRQVARCCSRRWPRWPRRRAAACSCRPRSRRQQVRLRAERLGALRPRPVAGGARPCCPTSSADIDEVAPDVVRRRLDPDACSTPSSARRPARSSQVRECAHRLVQEAKARGAGDRARRPRHQGRRAGRPTRARARRRHRALVRGRPPPRPAAAAGGQAPLRPHRRARPVRDGRRRPGRRARPERAVPRRPPRRRAPARSWCRRIEGHRPLLVELQALVAPQPSCAMPAPVGAGARRRPAGAAAGGARAAGRLPLGEADVYALGGRRGAGRRAGRRPGARAGPRVVRSADIGRCPPTSWRAARSASAASCARSARPRRRLAEAARLGLHAGARARSAPDAAAGHRASCGSATLAEAMRRPRRDCGAPAGSLNVRPGR